MFSDRTKQRQKTDGLTVFYSVSWSEMRLLFSRTNSILCHGAETMGILSDEVLEKKKKKKTLIWRDYIYLIKPQFK